MNQLWNRISAGQHTVVVGSPPGTPPSELGLRAIRVACDRPGGPLQPIREAQEKVDGIVGWPIQLLGTATDTLRRGLRESLLGERHATDDADRLAQSLTRLSMRSPRRHVVIFDAADGLSASAVNGLIRLLRVPGLITVPLVFSTRNVEVGSPLAALVEQLVATFGEDVVILGQDVSGHKETHADVISRLPPEIRETLRAAALIGEAFEAEVLAAALGLGLYDVLLRLQVATDSGVVLDDTGDGVFRLGHGLRESLLASLLPSLRRMMHLKIAAVLAEAESTQRAHTPVTSEYTQSDMDRITESVFGSPESPADLETTEFDDMPADPAEFHNSGPQEGVDEPFANPEVKDDLAPQAAPNSAQPAQFGRAAEHLAAGGQDDAALTQFLQAAHRALFMGNPIDGLVYSQRALALLDGMAPTPHHRVLRADALLYLAQAQFEAPVHETRSGLVDALATVQQALALCEESKVAGKIAAALSLSAQIHYEVGDAASMEAALSELTRAIELLAASGDPIGAARLLNDQASVFLRLGDPVRAYRLLEQSKETFLSRAQHDPIAVVELAETEHLIARLPLHVAARAGKESDSVRMGLEHAEAANRRYLHMGMDREAARVWETIGRLHLLGGETQAAIEILEKALRVQIELGDVIGMAKTVEALATGLAAMGRTSEALDLLGESVELNLVKGSPRGIAYLNTTFDKVTGGLRPEQQEQLAERIANLKQHLQVAGELIASDHSQLR